MPEGRRTMRMWIGKVMDFLYDPKNQFPLHIIGVFFKTVLKLKRNMDQQKTNR